MSMLGLPSQFLKHRQYLIAPSAPHGTFFFLILSMYVWDKCNLEMRHAKRLLTGQTVQFHWKRACPALIKALGSYPID